jgi:hypothetical protein
MEKSVKQLRVTTAAVLGRPDQTDIRLMYGRSGEIGTVRLHTDDFADFLESLRTSFPNMVVTQSPVRKREED